MPALETLVRYQTQPSGRIGLELFPPGKARPSINTDSLAHAKCVGDRYPGGFAHGHTMRDAHTFRLERRENDITILRNQVGHRIEHRLTPRGQTFEVRTTFFNDSLEPVTLEMLTSFSLGGISGQLRVHRFRSGWSAEGRHVVETIEQLHLEKSWAGLGAFSERFGQVGTLPVRKWFPFVAIEDVASGVLWGAQLAWAGSWQLEIYRRRDDVCISGGLADRELGHWTCRVEPGEALEAPPAFLACVSGGIEDLCDAFTSSQMLNAPAIEEDLPIVFNEWCTSWGEPSHDKAVALAERLSGTPVRYLVIDAGWYRSDQGKWYLEHGDWVPNPRLFPGGLEATARAIRERGLVPGLWFEMETCGQESVAFKMKDRLLQRDGIPITVGERRFWDLRQPEVQEYLRQRVLGLLKRGGFGYLKVDYNDSLGIGTDDPDGLRQQVLASYAFFDEIRRELPELVIENCASGGHRLEPSMLQRTAMSSFSDAHETPEIPIIAAHLHALVPARQLQIWAVLRKGDSARRLAYSLAATFLGRMCLSGDLLELSDAQMLLVSRAQRLYQRVAPILRGGSARRFARSSASWREPAGWQAVVRTCGDQLLLVEHTFANYQGDLHAPLPAGEWRVVEEFPSAALQGDFSARVVLMERR